MKAELVLMGKRVDMAPRQHRRILVVLIYGFLAAWTAGMWFVDQWRTSGYYLVLATFVINKLLLGGYNFGGLVKPFNGKAPVERMEPAPFLVLGLRVYAPSPEEQAFRNDERELAQRDRAHYVAYQWIAGLLAVLWLLAHWAEAHGRLAAEWHAVILSVLYLATLCAVQLALTLPQAILLWTEPDLEAFGD